MSITIIGGNECMEHRYKQLCKDYNCSAQICTKFKDMKNKMGKPDMVILFTNTVSHKMVRKAMSSFSKDEYRIVHAHSSSISSLKKILSEHAV